MMLLELRIGNLALAEDIVLRPGPGLTVLTGETGAGKSLIAGALMLLTAGRADRGMIRLGEETAWVEAVCDLAERADLQQDVARLGLRRADDGLLVIRRELRREGRGRVLINGDLSSLTILEQLGEVLFVVQSQHQQRELMSVGYARDLLDEALGLGELRRSVAHTYSEFRQTQSALTRCRLEHELACEQEEFWRHQHDELTAAALVEGEEEQLAEAIAIKRHAQAMQEGAAAALACLENEQGSVREVFGAAMTAVRTHAGRSQRLATALQNLEAAAVLASEACGELERFLDGLQTDPRGLAELQQRKALYEQLRRKHKRDFAGLVSLRDQLGERIGRHEKAFTQLSALESRLHSTIDELSTLCSQLHDARVKGAAAIASAAEAAIRPLALADLELSFSIEPLADIDGLIQLENKTCKVDASGADAVHLLVRTNPGEAMGDVGAFASGGELARIYLGLTLLRGGAKKPLVRLFDEVDAGLGMDAATPVAWLLCDLAHDTQAICITHLPTVAVHGRQHWLVTKIVQAGRTTVSLNELDESARLAEIARQLGGEGWQRGDALAQLAYARELLSAAGLGGVMPLKANVSRSGAA